MRTIWKYPLTRRGWNSWPLGKGSKVVLAALDNTTHAPTLWIEHERPAEPMRGIGTAPAELMINTEDIREFRVAVTDDDIPDDELHVGSMTDGRHVWHIYERAFRNGR